MDTNQSVHTFPIALLKSIDELCSINSDKEYKMNDIIIHNLIEQLDRIELKIDNRVLKNWLSINDVVQTVGHSKSTINRAIKNGELESVKNGGKRMFRKEWVDRWISG